MHKIIFFLHSYSNASKFSLSLNYQFVAHVPRPTNWPKTIIHVSAGKPEARMFS